MPSLKSIEQFSNAFTNDESYPLKTYGPTINREKLQF